MAKGTFTDFLMSGKCAGGSGRILQVMARVLQVKVEEIGELSLKSKKKVDFSTGCAVFAESEAISRISQEVKKEDLLAGIHRALAAQINSLAERMGIEQDVAMVGGGARDVGLVRAVREIRGHDVLVPASPHLTAALGCRHHRHGKRLSPFPRPAGERGRDVMGQFGQRSNADEWKKRITF